MSTLTLYTVAPSRGSHVRWMLEECAATYDTVHLSLGAALKTPDYLAVNPLGKVPALRHGDAVITETAAILTYLAELFPERGLIPDAGTPDRAQYYRWLLAATHLEYAVINRWLGLPQSEDYRRSCGYGDFDTAVAALRQWLAGREYAVGQRFSALDVFLSGLLAWAIHHTGVWPAEAVFTDYLQRHCARAACVRAQALDAVV